MRESRLARIVLTALVLCACAQTESRSHPLGRGWRLTAPPPAATDGRLRMRGLRLEGPAADGSLRAWTVTPFLDLNGDGRRQTEEPAWPGFRGRAGTPSAKAATGALGVPDPRAMLMLEVELRTAEENWLSWVPAGRR